MSNPTALGVLGQNFRVSRVDLLLTESMGDEWIEFTLAFISKHVA